MLGAGLGEVLSRHRQSRPPWWPVLASGDRGRSSATRRSLYMVSSVEFEPDGTAAGPVRVSHVASRERSDGSKQFGSVQDCMGGSRLPSRPLAIFRATRCSASRYVGNSALALTA